MLGYRRRMIWPTSDEPVVTEGGSVRLLTEIDREWRWRGPTARALQSFGARESSMRRLPGGAGFVWTDGRLVLKPVGCVAEHTWVCGVYVGWPAPDALRVPEPVLPTGASADEGWSVDGWGAHVFVTGRDVDLPGELSRVREAGDIFHALLVDLPRPGFIDGRDDPWAFGDRLAWEGIAPVGDQETLTVINELRVSLAPVSSRDQVIHGDLLPNVLLADGVAPAVIDWPPYFRPVGMANAIAVTDAVTFRGAPLSLLDEWESGDDWSQLLIRALLYRLGPTGIFAVRNRLMGGLVTHLQRVRPVIDAVLSRSPR